MAGTLSDQFKSRLNLQTKTVGDDRIKRAKERNEDVAILSMELPGEKKPFRCALDQECLLGDPEGLPLGAFSLRTTIFAKYYFKGCSVSFKVGINYVLKCTLGTLMVILLSIRL